MMKKINYLLVLVLSAAGISSCEPTWETPYNNVPQVSSVSVKNLSATSATVEAQLSNLDPPSISEYGFHYAEANAFVLGQKIKVVMPRREGDNLLLSIKLTGLRAGTRYKCEAYVANWFLPEITGGVATFQTPPQ